jgi:hypothetical protein
MDTAEIFVPEAEIERQRFTFPGRRCLLTRLNANKEIPDRRNLMCEEKKVYTQLFITHIQHLFIFVRYEQHN